MPRKTPKLIWASIAEYYRNNVAFTDENGIVFDENKEEAFVNTFVDLYERVKSHYMRNDVTDLDHHKQAAIIIYSLIKNSVIYSSNYKNVEYGNNPKQIKLPEGQEYIFIELEKIALKAGLEYMANALNDILRKVGSGEKQIVEYNLPEPISCDNSYFIVLVRQLFYDFHYGNISNDEVYILSLANTLYLIEYMNLIEKKIDISKLKKSIKSGTINN